jgi:WD40 repeat protein
MTTPSTTGDGQEGPSPIEIDANSEIRVVTFSANGEYLVGGGTDGVRVWRVEDGEEIAAMEAPYVRCICVSKDGKWIAAGTYKDVIVWDATTYEPVFTHEETYVNAVDFSPDSTRLVTGSLNSTASILDIPARQRVLGPIRHKDVVIAARYSPNGTRIATATPNSVRVWDSSDGGSSIDIPVKIPPWYNTALLWSHHHLFIVSDSRIKQFDSSTGSEVSDWPVPDSNDSSCIALPQHGEFIAYATDHAVTVWDSSTHAQLGLIQHPQRIRSIALSPDNRLLVTGGEGGQITIKSLARINASIVYY